MAVSSAQIWKGRAVQMRQQPADRPAKVWSMVCQIVGKAEEMHKNPEAHLSVPSAGGIPGEEEMKAACYLGAKAALR